MLFLVLVVLCLLAPVYASDIAHTGPNENHITEQIRVGGKLTYVVNTIGLPIGPTWHSHFFLGADPNGRDVAVRLLYGGRNSLEIGRSGDADHDDPGDDRRPHRRLLPAACVDGILTRVLDIIWAYPVVHPRRRARRRRWPRRDRPAAWATRCWCPRS